MNRGYNLVGNRYGMLVVLRRFDVRQWACKCDCGNVTYPYTGALVRGATQSCGCNRDKAAGISLYTHGHSRKGKHTSAYSVWSNMLTRCTNPHFHQWADYGGRGIGIDDPRWYVFEHFYADMGDPPNGLTLDRKDNNLGYSKGNCRWATPLEQRHNRG
jgi:hypothetical protein